MGNKREMKRRSDILILDFSAPQSLSLIFDITSMQWSRSSLLAVIQEGEWFSQFSSAVTYLFLIYRSEDEKKKKKKKK